MERRADDPPEIQVRKGRAILNSTSMSYAQSARLTLVIADAYDRARRPIEAVEILRPRVSEAEGAQQRYWRGRVSSMLASFYLLHFAEVDISVTIYEAALADFESANEKEWMATTLSMLGLANRAAGESARSAESFTRALNIYGYLATPTQRVSLSVSLAAAHLDGNRFLEAESALSGALAQANSGEGIDDTLRACLFAYAAIAKAGLKQKRVAEQFLVTGKEAAQRAGDSNSRVVVDMANARLLELSGKSNKAIDALIEVSRFCGDRAMVLPHFDVLRLQIRIGKESGNYGASLGAMEMLARLEARMATERSKLKLIDLDTQRNLDSAQAFTRRLQLEVAKQTQTLAETVRKLESEAQHRQISEKRSEFLAGHDLVTGLSTRRRLVANLEHTVSILKSGDCLPVLMIGIEPPAGLRGQIGIVRNDEILARVAKILEEVSPTCFLARFSDWRFACIAPSVEEDGAEAATSELGEIIRHALSMPLEVDRSSITLDTSVGIAFARAPSENASNIIANADAAMEKARDNYAARTQIYDADLAKKLGRRRDLEAALATANADSGIFITYQPLVDAQSSAVCGFESLIRWKHATHGMVSPVEFIPMAESLGLIESLGILIAELALRDFGRVLIGVYPDAYITVNVSLLQLRDTHFVSNLLNVCRNTRVDPKRVMLEITESQLVDDGETMQANLKRLRLHGFRLAIDDFGTGYSSLWRLSQIDMQTIKIARELVVGAQQNEQSKKLFHRAVQICHDLGRTVVAEGIEGEQERNDAIEAGCDQLQGYLFSKPMPAEELVANLAWQSASV